MKTRSKLLSIALSLALAVGLCPVPALAQSDLAASASPRLTTQAAAHTQAEAVAYANSLIGQPVHSDNNGSLDCVDVARAYYNYLGVGMRYGNGYDYARGNQPDGWTRVYSNPQPGDVATWDAWHGVAQQWGHVAVVVAVSGSTIYVAQQDTGAQRNCWREEYNASNPSSYLRPNWPNDNPIGSLDIVEGRSGTVFVRGWAFDPNDMARLLDIHVYVGADSSAAGREGHSIKANLERADVDNVYGCGKNHGFSTEVATNKSGRQTVYVYAINVGAGGNVLLGSATVNIGNVSPLITMDSLHSDSTGTVTVEGWAFDPSDTSKAISVHAYAFVGKQPHFLGGTIADLERKDVNKTYGCGNNHGFKATFCTPVSGNVRVNVAAINIGGGENVWGDRENGDRR